MEISWTFGIDSEEDLERLNNMIKKNYLHIVEIVKDLNLTEKQLLKLSVDADIKLELTFNEEEEA